MNRAKMSLRTLRFQYLVIERIDGSMQAYDFTVSDVDTINQLVNGLKSKYKEETSRIARLLLQVFLFRKVTVEVARMTSVSSVFPS